MATKSKKPKRSKPPSFESELLKFISAGATKPYDDVIARMMHEHHDELRALEFPVNRHCIPGDPTMASFIGEHWPRSAGRVPDLWLLTCLSIVLMSAMVDAENAPRLTLVE